MPYTPVTEGATATHTDVNALFSSVYADTNTIDPATSVREYALGPEHLPSPIVFAESAATDLGAGTHAYAGSSYGYVSLSSATWAVVGSALGTPENMSVSFSCQTTDATQNNFVGCLEIQAQVAVTSVTSTYTRGYGVLAVQLNIGGTWTNFTWTQRIIEIETGSLSHVDLSYIFSGSDLAAGTVTGARLVVSASGANLGDNATITLEEANIIALGYRAKVLA
jgi:hypothetical protein